MMNSKTGRLMDEIAHIEQSIHCILMTRIGSRVLREDFGSMIARLVDAPYSNTRILQIMSAVFIALMQWEPRITVKQVTPKFDGSAQKPKLIINIQYEYKGQLLSVEV